MTQPTQVRASDHAGQLGTRGNQNAGDAADLAQAVATAVDQVFDVVVPGVNGVAASLNKPNRGIAELIETLVVYVDKGK